MAAPPGAKYVAIRDIPWNGVAAYRAGHLVHESAVEGEHAWLKIGEDVKPVEGAQLNRPPLNAATGAWAAYAISKGADPEWAEDAGRRELIAWADEHGE